MRLNQIIAIEKTTKAKAQHDVDEIYKAAQKPSNFDGFTKTYRRKNDEDDEVPPQRQNVQLVAEQALNEIADRWTLLFNVTADKDVANRFATAEVALDGLSLEALPVTYLLFLEKQLTDLHTIVSKFPTLDPAHRWKKDANSDEYVTEPELTTRTKKTQRALVLHPPTIEHPAQTQLITEDVAAGTWEHVRRSGALPAPRKRQILDRIEALQRAVKIAREEANEQSVDQHEIGAKLFSWILRT